MRDAIHRPHMRQILTVRRFIRRGLVGVGVGAVGFVALSIFSVSILAFAPVVMTPLVVIRAVEAGWAGRPIHFSKDWISIEQMPANLLRSAIASEDFRFNEHRGFDFDAIEKARKANQRVELRGRGRIRGASTISQQTAKNVFLFPSRTWVRKGLEVWMTVLIEMIWSKRRILEVYLNVVEMGDGIYGVEAASRAYFRKPAKNLTASESALLVAVLPNPRKLHVDRPSSYVRYRQESILRRLSYVDLPE